MEIKESNHNTISEPEPRTSEQIGSLAVMEQIATQEPIISANDDEVRLLLDDLESRPYTETRQLTYPDREELLEAMHELTHTNGDASPTSIRATRDRLAVIHASDEKLIRIAGACLDRVDAHQNTDELVEDKSKIISLVQADEPESEVVIRMTTEKPRSKPEEEIKPGEHIQPYCGDGINNIDPSKRTPNARQLPAVIAQVRTVSEKLEDQFGKRITTARETLSVPLMLSMMRRTPQGTVISGESDIIWLGDRTRQLDGVHVSLLEELQPENVIGVKIGPTATSEDIKGLSDKLNPDNEDGKLILMFRMGLNNMHIADKLLTTVSKVAPKSILMYDIHGTVEEVDGMKVRNVTTMIEECRVLAELCRKHGLRLHGTHVEAMGNNVRKECADQKGDEIQKPEVMDPKLNLSQLKRFHSETAKFL